MAVTTIPQYSPILVAKPTVDLEARDSRIRSSSNMEEPIIVRAAATVLDGTFRRNGSLQVITTSNSDHNDYRQLQAGSRRSTDLSAAASEFQRQRASLLASRKMRKTVSSSALYNRTSTMMSDGSCTSVTSSMISANNNGRSQSPLPPGQRSKSSSTAGGILGLPSPCSPAPRERKLAAGSPGGHHGQGFAPPTPGRAPPRFRSSSATRFSDASDCSSSVVPKFGDWDETDPSSADGYTHIFNRVREERHATAANAPPSKTATTHSRNTNKKHHRRRNSNSNNKSWYHCFTCF